MTKKNVENNWPMMILVAVVALGIGFLVGRMGQDLPPHPEVQDSEASAEPTELSPQSNSPTSISPEQLAKEKNVPATINSPQGDFTLVAVVEGEDANRSLHRSLKVVGVQRQRLAQLSRQYDQTAPTMAQQRELIAGQINETRMTLEKNLKFMAQNYAYVLSNNYLLVPHQATLSLVEGVGENQKKTVVKTFVDAKSYEAFQQKNEAYGKLKREQLKAHQASQPASEQPKPEDPPKSPSPLPLTQEMKTMQAEMIKLYQCDPEKTYLVAYQKTALYARKAQ